MVIHEGSKVVYVCVHATMCLCWIHDYVCLSTDLQLCMCVNRFTLMYKYL